MFTIRLSDDIEAQLKLLMTLENKTKTEIVRSALSEYIGSRLPEKSAYELGEELFGKHSSNLENLSETYKARLKTKLNEKHSH